VATVKVNISVGVNVCRIGNMVIFRVGIIMNGQCAKLKYLLVRHTAKSSRPVGLQVPLLPKLLLLSSSRVGNRTIRRQTN